MPNRRRLVQTFGAGVLLAPVWGRAQQPGRTYRIGWLQSIDDRTDPYNKAYVQRLSELGFIEGRNLVIEFRHAGGRPEQLPGLAVELARQNCDLFFGGGTEAGLIALRQASRDTPIVFVAVDFDPVATGHIVSLARPDGRITGITALQSALPAKRLELLKELLPGARKVAVFANATTTGQLAVVQDAAQRLGLALHVVDFKSPPPPFDYEAGFAAAVRAKAAGLLVLGSGLFVPGRRKIPELALKYRLPTIFHHSQWAEAGGLMSYGFNFVEMWQRAAAQSAAILRGAKPGDIPMEQGLKYEFAFNMKTAKALRLTIPQSILIRADRIIE